MSNSKVWVPPPSDADDYTYAGTSAEAGFDWRSRRGFPPLAENALGAIENYGRENPLSFGLWMLGIGFVLGWKLKIW